MHIFLVDKRSGSLWPVTYTCEPFFFFHVVNSFQQGSQYVVIDLIAYKDAEVNGPWEVVRSPPGAKPLTLLFHRLQILSDLKFSHIERTDHVQHATPVRINLPLQNTMVVSSLAIGALRGEQDLGQPDVTWTQDLWHARWSMHWFIQTELPSSADLGRVWGSAQMVVGSVKKGIDLTIPRRSSRVRSPNLGVPYFGDSKAHLKSFNVLKNGQCAF